jgi:hypothetical protein
VTQKKSYSRYFIILQEDERGYALASDKLPSGYAKLEMKNEKCKISYYVQNLKKESAPYYMMLICNKKEVNKIIKLGELNIDDHGRAEVSYEYEVDNICGTGIAMDKIVGASICRFIDNNIVSVMCGFASTDIPQWKSFQVVEEAKQKDKDETQEEVKSIFDKYEENIENVKSSKNEEIIIPNEKSDRQNIKDTDYLVLEVKEVKEEIENKGESIVNARAEEPHVQVDVDIHNAKALQEEPVYSDEQNELRHKHKKKETDECNKGSMEEFFHDIAKGFDEVEDICCEIKRCKWHKVNVKCLEEIPYDSNYNKYNVVYYPMVSYYPHIKKYGHYLLGYKKDLEGKMKYLVYAIPGCNCKIDQPFEGRTGFVTWVPGKNSEEYFGYWLMFYDFRNSTIVIPVK